MKKYKYANKKYKIRYKDSSFNKDTLISTVSVQSKFGIFEGRAKFNPEDADKYRCSRYLGCQIAEWRAVIKALKANLSRTRYLLKKGRTFYVTVLDMKNHDVYSTESKAMRKELNKLEKEILSIKEEISHYERIIKEYINII